MYVLLLTLACWCVSTSVTSADYYEPESAATYFEDFMIKFEKQYINEHEKAFRFEIFKSNLEHINRLNKESYHAVFAINLFTDLTSEEFTAMHTGLRSDDDADYCTMLTDEDIPDAGAPESLDWRELNAVTRVKDQRTCGSCWAFSAIGHLEGQQAMKHKKLLELSEQQIMDCDSGSYGCHGGHTKQAFKAAIKIGGVMLENDYPYEAMDDTCKTDLSKAVVKVTDCFSYNLTSQEKVKQLLYKVGPISISFKPRGVHHHSKGILMDSQCYEGPISHAVLLVGYGTENNIPYWILKNSWSAHWGESGYFRMQRSDNPKGACGMLNDKMATAVIE